VIGSRVSLALVSALAACAALAGAAHAQTTGAPIYPFAAPLSPGGPALLHHSDVEVALAARVRPYLFFDKTERWRPLVVAAFMHEQFSDGRGHHLWAERGYLEIHGSKPNGVDYSSPAAGTCFDAKRARRDAGLGGPSRAALPTPAHAVDCDRGAPSATYYRRTTHAGLWYWDYWVFYRYNDYNGKFNRCRFYCDDHEGDWEGTTIVTTRDVLAPQVVGALYAEHENRIAVGRSALILDPTGQHASVFVAAGTHASYRFRCLASCD
jgi:hypothetical protein